MGLRRQSHRHTVDYASLVTFVLRDDTVPTIRQAFIDKRSVPVLWRLNNNGTEDAADIKI
jgi:hypothetical protein